MSRPSRLASLLPLLALGPWGCVGPSPGVMAERTGVSGWFQVRLDEATRRQRYSEWFERVPLAVSSPPCAEVTKRLTGDGPLLVVVHGIGGDGEEWVASLGNLARAPVGGVFMYRWVPYEERDVLAQRLATGLTRLLRCAPRPMVVLAHSAGGVVSSYAASLVAVPPSAELTVVTVASPLAGTVARAARPDGQQEVRFMLDLGSSILGYPESAPRVSVVHLRTSAPADHVMKPTEEGHRPNDPKVAVPNGRQLDLPASLSHVGALLYVSRRMADDGWLAWLGELPPTPSP